MTFRRVFIITAFLLSLLLPLAACADDAVILPDSYESGSLRYPVIYVLPDAVNDSAAEIFAARLAESMTDDVLDMILICPDLDESENAADAL
ncbi:MAG: hypothetical protein IJT77_00470, partial [Clostridia bacterium]|nr:hypothetical protein [Clostridia bacterium]